MASPVLIVCTGCETEYKIVFTSGEGNINYCPNCGDEIDMNMDDDMWEELDYEESDDWD